MMETLSASKNAAIDERPKPITSKPMRIHELLGLPKSATKAADQQRLEPVRLKYLFEPMGSCEKQTSNPTGPAVITSKPVRIHELLGVPKSAGKVTEQQRLEPVRVKYLFEPMGSCDRQTNHASASARRATVAPGVARNVRRQLLPDPADGPLPDESASTGESQPTGAAFARLLGNVDSQTKPVRLGLSKSDGKAKINHQRLQPVRTKYLMESWEKNQTVKPEGEKSNFRGPRTTNVRRKLYAGCPSPAPPKNVARKSLAANKFQETVNTPCKSGKIVKPNAEKSAKTAAAARKPTRKSCLLPPNSIRDQHIGKQGKETIVEESPTEFSDQTQKITRPDKNPAATKKPKVNVENALKLREIATFPKAASTPRVPQVADPVAPSCERNHEESENGRSQIDQRNLPWLRDNFQHCIRMTEEQLLSLKQMVEVTEEKLLSMKQMLEVIEEMMMTKNTEPEEMPLQENTENCIPAEIPKIVVKSTEAIEESEAQFAARENEIFEEKRETKCDENFAVDPEGDKENVPAIGDEALNDEQSESGEKPRRRSARLAAIEAARSPDNGDDSFSRIESELNITHAKSKPATPLTTASAKRNKLDPQSKRSIREYMMIKSCAKFLQTPDHKGLPTPRADRTGTPAERRAIERALSRQLLSQLTDLYDDSSE